MLIKIVSLFLIGMVVLAMFGRLRLPGTRGVARKCRACGAPRIARARCPCGKA